MYRMRKITHFTLTHTHTYTLLTVMCPPASSSSTIFCFLASSLSITLTLTRAPSLSFPTLTRSPLTLRSSSRRSQRSPESPLVTDAAGDVYKYKIQSHINSIFRMFVAVCSPYQHWSETASWSASRQHGLRWRRERQTESGLSLTTSLWVGETIRKSLISQLHMYMYMCTCRRLEKT